MSVYASNLFPSPITNGDYTILGTASSNTTITLSESLDNYEWVMLCGVAGNKVVASHLIPVMLFARGGLWRLCGYNGTYRTITAQYSTATKVVITGRTTMNITIVGVKA